MGSQQAPYAKQGNHECHEKHENENRKNNNSNTVFLFVSFTWFVVAIFYTGWR
jgi:hypothetical protein